MIDSFPDLAWLRYWLFYSIIAISYPVRLELYVTPESLGGFIKVDNIITFDIGF